MMERLLQVLVEEVRAEVRRLEDRAAAEARRLVAEAEDRVEGLTRAARDLGRARGAIADASLAREADAEVARIRATAFEALLGRFEVRVRAALEELPREADYGDALTALARRAARAMDRPSEVFCASRDRQALYDALLAAGARDFRVLADAEVRSGFVVRDLDGRTLLDVRPAALLAEGAPVLRSVLAARVPPFSPEGEVR